MFGGGQTSWAFPQDFCVAFVNRCVVFSSVWAIYDITQWFTKWFLNYFRFVSHPNWIHNSNHRFGGDFTSCWPVHHWETVETHCQCCPEDIFGLAFIGFPILNQSTLNWFVVPQDTACGASMSLQLLWLHLRLWLFWNIKNTVRIDKNLYFDF